MSQCNNCGGGTSGTGGSSQYADNVLRKIYPDNKGIGELSNCGDSISDVYVHLENNSLVIDNVTIPLNFLNEKVNSYSYNTITLTNNSPITSVELLPTTDYVILISESSKILQYRFDSDYITLTLDCKTRIESEDNFLTAEELEEIEKQSYTQCCNDSSNYISVFDVATMKYLSQYYMYWKWNILKAFTATFIPPAMFDKIMFKVVDSDVQHKVSVVQLDIAHEV